MYKRIAAAIHDSGLEAHPTDYLQVGRPVAPLGLDSCPLCLKYQHSGVLVLAVWSLWFESEQRTIYPRAPSTQFFCLGKRQPEGCHTSLGACGHPHPLAHQKSKKEPPPESQKQAACIKSRRFMIYVHSKVME